MLQPQFPCIKLCCQIMIHFYRKIQTINLPKICNYSGTWPVLSKYITGLFPQYVNINNFANVVDESIFILVQIDTTY